MGERCLVGPLKDSEVITNISEIITKLIPPDHRQKRYP